MDDDGAQIVVDGETFIVRQTDGVWTYDWVSGPNPNYGFSGRVRGFEYIDAGAGTILPGSGKYVDPAPDTPPPDHEEAIRDFLAMIDPETGYIGD
ncbi:hypothetical protein [Gordonia humi]|uniref:Uncharacterized protein n=1 Tax=Gordonia humi TaxID=686429 RepID=A0A840F608_9ACTN|nr:hypothetical protein [Gordonia humi]MBB4136959.1 hypothetical protein [Gordonia humi]